MISPARGWRGEAVRHLLLLLHDHRRAHTGYARQNSTGRTVRETGSQNASETDVLRLHHSKRGHRPHTGTGHARLSRDRCRSCRAGWLDEKATEECGVIIQWTAGILPAFHHRSRHHHINKKNNPNALDHRARDFFC